MHEVSIARAIIGIVREQCNGADPEDIRRVNIRVGASSGVVPESLRFAFQALTAEDFLHRASLAIEVTPFRVHCSDCGIDSGNDSGLGICGRCGGSNVEIRSGTELEVSSIELREEADEYHHG